MKILELRVIDNKYTIIADGNPSSTVFDIRFRMMALNKFKFTAKNSVVPFIIKVEDENGKEIVNQEIHQLAEIDKIK